MASLKTTLPLFVIRTSSSIRIPMATLVNRELKAGEHRVAWDGVLATGRPTVPGVYFVRIAAAGMESSRKVVRVR